MASVQDIVACPQCGQGAYLMLQTRDLSESIFCPRCGYRESTRLMIDRQRQRADPEQQSWYKVRKDGERIYRTTRHTRLGAYRIQSKKGIATLGMLNCRLTAKIIAAFERDLNHADVDRSSSYLTRWNPKRRKVEVVLGKLPRDIP